MTRHASSTTRAPGASRADAGAEGGPSGAKTSAARERIMASALELFAADGFGSTSVRSVARRAGLSQGLLYTYFASKDDLLRAVFEDGMRDVWSSLAPLAGEAPSQGLENLLRRSFELVAQHEDLWRLLYSLRSQPGVVERLGLEIGRWNEVIETELERLCARAGLPRPRIGAKVLFALIDGANQHRLLDKEDYPVDQVISAAVAMLQPRRES